MKFLALAAGVVVAGVLVVQPAENDPLKYWVQPSPHADHAICVPSQAAEQMVTHGQGWYCEESSVNEVVCGPNIDGPAQCPHVTHKKKTKKKKKVAKKKK